MDYDYDINIYYDEVVQMLRLIPVPLVQSEPEDGFLTPDHTNSLYEQALCLPLWASDEIDDAISYAIDNESWQEAPIDNLLGMDEWNVIQYLTEGNPPAIITEWLKTIPEHYA